MQMLNAVIHYDSTDAHYCSRSVMAGRHKIVRTLMPNTSPYKRHICHEWSQQKAPVLRRDMAGEAALLSLEGPLPMGREGGRV